MQTSAETPELIIASYEELKRNFTPPGETETTEKLCSHHGFRFVPMVVESHSGSWGKEARQMFATIAKHAAITCTETCEPSSLTLVQRLSVTLHRENARAIVRRMQERIVEASDTLPDLGPGAW